MPANTNKPTPPSKKAIFPNPKSCSGFSTRETKLGFLSSTNGLLGLLLAEKGSCSGLLPWGPTGEGAPLAKILEATLLRQLPCLESLNTLQNHARLTISTALAVRISCLQTYTRHARLNAIDTLDKALPVYRRC